VKTGILSKELSVALIFATLMGVSFPPVSLYPLAFFAFVPLMIFIERNIGTSRVTWGSLLAILLMNVVTLYWIGGYTHGKDPFLMIGGLASILINSMVMSIPLLIVISLYRRKKRPFAFFFLPFLWVSMEYLHSQWELAFPWLLIGNSQAANLLGSQWADTISTYGLSLWILLVNVLIFVLHTQWKEKSFRILYVTAIAIFLIVPHVYGLIKINEYDASSFQKRLDVSVIQPNVDPWEKWGHGSSDKWESYRDQIETLERMSYAEIQKARSKGMSPRLLIYPETAIPFHILLPSFAAYQNRFIRLGDSLGADIFSGLPDGEYLDSSRATATANPIAGTNYYFESYNSAAMISRPPIPPVVYRKNLLVPFGERLPYAETFSFLLEFLSWGVGISSWGKGTEQTLFKLTEQSFNASFTPLICFESVFPSYARKIVDQGADFLVIVTNDSWYGNTSGPYQHADFGALRAIETGRWVVRSANGGISGIIDPLGRYTVRSAMFEQTSLSGSIYPTGTRTLYVFIGDLIPVLSIVVTILLLIFLITELLRDKWRASHETGY